MKEPHGVPRIRPVNRTKLYAQVGARIRKARESKAPRITQSDLATLLNVERTSVTNIESGSQRATLAFLYGVARHLNVPLMDLLPDIEDPNILAGTDVAEITIGKRKRTVPAQVKSVFDKV